MEARAGVPSHHLPLEGTVHVEMTPFEDSPSQLQRYQLPLDKEDKEALRADVRNAIATESVLENDGLPLPQEAMDEWA